MIDVFLFVLQKRLSSHPFFLLNLSSTYLTQSFLEVMPFQFIRDEYLITEIFPIILVDWLLVEGNYDPFEEIMRLTLSVLNL